MRLDARAESSPALHVLVLLLGSTSAVIEATPVSSSSLLQSSERIRVVRPPVDGWQGVVNEPKDIESTGTRSNADLVALKDYDCYGRFELPANESEVGFTVVVAGHPDCDVTWLGEQPHRAVVVSDIDRVGSRKYSGYEAGAYLSFILENYDDLPPKMAFMHGHRTAWEVNDEAGILQYLGPSSYDFATLTNKWHIIFPTKDVPRPETIRGQLQDMFGQDHALVRGFPTATYNFSFAAGAAFLVDRKRVLLRPKRFWQVVYDWLQEEPDPVKSKGRAMTMECIWHMLMGEAPEMMPPDPRRLCPTMPVACTHGLSPEMYLPSPDRLEWYSAHDNDGKGAYAVP